MEALLMNKDHGVTREQGWHSEGPGEENGRHGKGTRCSRSWDNIDINHLHQVFVREFETALLFQISAYPLICSASSQCHTCRASSPIVLQCHFQ
jgi:hypothetical protein